MARSPIAFQIGDYTVSLSDAYPGSIFVCLRFHVNWTPRSRWAWVVTRLVNMLIALNYMIDLYT